MDSIGIRDCGSAASSQLEPGLSYGILNMNPKKELLWSLG